MKINSFIKEVLAEMKNVKWPTNRMAIISTLAVIIISVLVGAYLYGVDTILKSLLAYLSKTF